MNKLLILSLLVFASFAQAQVTKPKVHSVELYSGVTIEGTRLLYVKPVLQGAKFTLDSITYNTDSIAFVSNNHGTFANLHHIMGGKNESFAMRIRKGNLHLYELVDIEIYGYDKLNIPTGSEDRTAAFLASGEHFEFYRKGTGRVKKASYANLRLDLASNEESMAFLKRYRFHQFLQAGMILAGTAITTTDALLQDSDNLRITPIGALGIVVIGSSFFNEYPKRDLLWQAVEAYN